MKMLALLCSFVLLFSGALTAQEVKSPPPAVDNRLPGITLAEGVSQITGTAVSPLLGMSAVGAWKYFTTPEAKRHLLPWYCHHYVWGSCFIVLGMCFLKDFLGAAAPALVKKPLDFAELFEDKISALVASGAFVPLIANAMAQMNSIPDQNTTFIPAELGMATIPFHEGLNISWAKFGIFLPLSLLAFAVVWLACHSINVLIAMSPFGIVDAGLKLFKASLLALITGATFISPVLGLIVCIPLIIVAFLISGWTFRLTAFGSIFGLDVLLQKKADAHDVAKSVKGFNVKTIGKTPVRSYGEIHRETDGRLIFRQRPWLILPMKEEVLDPAPNGLAKGVFYPSVTHQLVDGRPRMQFILLPRYRDAMPFVAEKFGIHNVTDSTLLKSFKAMRQWLVDILSLGKTYHARSLQ